MVSWNNLPTSSPDGESVNSPEGSKCNYVEWVDDEWPAQLKMALGTIWDMYEDNKRLRLRQNIVSAEENLKMLKEKEKMEKDLRFFKVDFAKMVADKDQALEQLGNTQIALFDLKEEIEKKKISDKSATNIHQVVRAKAEKDRDLMKEERDLIKQKRDLMKQEMEYSISISFQIVLHSVAIMNYCLRVNSLLPTTGYTMPTWYPRQLSSFAITCVQVQVYCVARVTTQNSEYLLTYF
ncbi:uncharacterized protein LOC123440087 [Hordeum vulgare subsp. vulgare]|uniref:uncharacterized protein LOC123440087 n=1 Tax=Hordeum vulgare subsp. vulgare TaxID=112509 RepID=UPI00162C089E|nr:uncharacterized protein LOC123440087 [Hordeum vulgare subsp. vulgare]